MSLLVMPGRRLGTRLVPGVAVATGVHPLEAKLLVGRIANTIGYWKGNTGTLTPTHAWGAEIEYFAVDFSSDNVLLGFVGGVQPLGLTDVKVEVFPAGPFPLTWNGVNSRYDFIIPGAGAYFDGLMASMVLVGFDPRPLA